MTGFTHPVHCRHLTATTATPTGPVIPTHTHAALHHTSCAPPRMTISTNLLSSTPLSTGHWANWHTHPNTQRCRLWLCIQGHLQHSSWPPGSPSRHQEKPYTGVNRCRLCTPVVVPQQAQQDSVQGLIIHQLHQLTGPNAPNAPVVTASSRLYSRWSRTACNAPHVNTKCVASSSGKPQGHHTLGMTQHPAAASCSPASPTATSQRAAGASAEHRGRRHQPDTAYTHWETWNLPAAAQSVAGNWPGWIA